MSCTSQEPLTDNADGLAVGRNDQLVIAAQAGAPEAFAELHATYSRRLYKTIVAITRNREDAEDALQETFLRAHLGLRAFEGRSGIYSWLTRIAINSALVVLRRRRSRPDTLPDRHQDSQVESFFLEIEDPNPNPEQICESRQRRVRLLRAICRLEPPLQAPIRMRMTLGASIKEISRALNLSEAAVKTRLHRARSRLSTMHDLKHFAVHRQDSLPAGATARSRGHIRG